MSLKKAIAWNGLSQMGQSGIQFLSTIILARLLTPDDFGVLGMITIFISFSQMIVDSEMGGALLKKQDVKSVDYSTLFLYNLVVSLILYLILFFIAPLISSFYDKPVLVPAIRILALSVLIHSFRVVQRVMILRNLQFKLMANINIVSGVLSLIIAIILAKMDYGFWALVGQQLSLITLGVILMCVNNRYIPALRFSKESFKEQFSFASGLLGADVLKTIANNINTNIIAKIMPLAQVGYFVQSSRLTNFGVTFTGSIMDQTLFPVMSKYNSDDKVRETYIKFYNLASILITLATGWVVLVAKPLVILMLGENWSESGWILQLLVLSLLPCTIQVICKNLLKVKGETKKVFYAQLFQSIAVLSLLLISSFFGMTYIIISYVVAQSLSALWMINIACNEIKLSWKDQLWSIIKTAFLTFVVVSIVSYLKLENLTTLSIVNILVNTLIYMSVLLTLITLFVDKTIVKNLVSLIYNKSNNDN